LLLNFRLRNYRSFRDEQRLALQGDPALEPLRAVALYGANASGKTNLLRALRFGHDAVARSHQTWRPDEGIKGRAPFLLGSSADEPTAVEFVVQVGQTRYVYGFECDRTAFVREWLYRYSTNRRTLLFERSSPTEIRFGRALGGPNALVAETMRPNSLFLSAAAASNHQGVRAIYHWLSTHFAYIGPQDREFRLRESLEQLEGSEAAGRLQQTLALLRAADVGIVDVSVVREPISDEQATMMGRFLALLEESAPQSMPSNALDDLLAFASRRFRFAHQGETSKPTTLEIDDESYGTQAVIALSGPILDALKIGSCLAVDELDASLHPHLVAAIVGLFKSPESNPRGAQLIFTTHDTSLLSKAPGTERVLDRREVWFVDKGSDGESSLVPLSDFSPRQAADFERTYLQGRYGGVPLLGRLDAALTWDPHRPASAT